jgi:N6-adenosine-specific RNA methylase IME4
VWGKDKVGLGRWNRNKHEILLLGVKGNVPCPAPGTQWDSLIMAPRREHSAKPECFLEMIEQYFPNVPKIELNRRGPARPGWAAWGNEALPNDELQKQAIQPASHDIAQPAQTAAPQSPEDDPYYIPDCCLRGHPDCVIAR